MEVASTTERLILRPLHGIILAFPISLFSASLATDIAYLRTAEIQWTNFSAWLIVGALVFGGLAMAWGLVSWFLGRGRPGGKMRLSYLGAVALMWILGLINAFKHSQDAWSSVGAFGLTLSILCTVLALAAGAIAYSRPAPGEAR